MSLKRDRKSQLYSQHKNKAFFFLSLVRKIVNKDFTE